MFVNYEYFKKAFTIAFVSVILVACKVDLYSNIEERQANEMAAVLMQHGIVASRIAGQDGNMTIQVAESEFAQSVNVLKQAGLPREQFATLGSVFQKDSLVASPVQERAQMIYALSQELSRTVSDIDGVVSARVHLVLPENDPLKQNLLPSSASIFIRHHSDAPISDLLPQIKMLVANGVAGLSYDKVSAVLVPVDNAISIAKASAYASAANASGGGSAITAYILLGIAIIIAIFGGFLMWQRRQRVYPLEKIADAK